MRSMNRRVMMATSSVFALFGQAALAQAPAPAPTAPAAPKIPDTDWTQFGGDLASTRYSPLDQINASNFNKLELAWKFNTDAFGPTPDAYFNSTPLIVKGRIFTTVGMRRDVVALDGATGELLWAYRYDEGARLGTRGGPGFGCAYWTDGSEERVIFVTRGYTMISLDAKTGLPDPKFGVNGLLDLRLNNDQEIDPNRGVIGIHAPPLVVRNVVVVGSAPSAAVKGYLRGFDVRTGQRKWIFHTIPRKGEFGYDTWIKEGQAEKAGNVGVWAPMSADPELGLVYAGVELPPTDLNGTERLGNALFSESLVALDIETGVRKWHYQLTHHGLWDYDIPCAAIICDLNVNGRAVKAIAQPSKQGYLYVLNRETGKPVWPIPERPVPKGDVPGEWYSPTQPIPSKPPAFDRQGFGESDIVDFTPEIKEKALAIAKYYKWGPVYTAPIMPKKGGPYGVINMPGYIGGINWPGGAYDPEDHMVYTYSQTNLLTIGNLIPNPGLKMGEFDMVHVNPPGDTPGIQPGNLTVDGIPLVKPPYGRITATNLAKGTQEWQTVHGETPDNIRNHPLLKGVKIPRTGMIGKIGPLATKSLVICGDPMTYTDETGRHGARLRAYDKKTGEEKGAIFLPAQQTGSPMTYMLGGRQYIVLAVGGRGYSAAFIAFRLPGAADNQSQRRRGGG